MTRYDIAQIVGVGLVVLGGQGAVRLLFDNDDGGLLAWLPAGFVVHLVVHLLVVLAGGMLAAWARSRSAAADPV